MTSIITVSRRLGCSQQMRSKWSAVALCLLNCCCNRARRLGGSRIELFEQPDAQVGVIWPRQIVPRICFLPSLDCAHVGFPAQVERLIVFLNLIGSPLCKVGRIGRSLAHASSDAFQNVQRRFRHSVRT